ncbi:MAG: 2-oxoglutarate and iron-dependent oxygenase domain-containing protein [Acidimicrobiales bacterium]
MPDRIVDVDLLAFENGDRAARRAVVDGVRRSLETGFVYTTHDIPAEVLDAAYELLAAFFALPPDVKQRYVDPESHGQSGYTGLLVETAASSDAADWKEMLNWGDEVPAGHPLRRRYPHRYRDQVLPEADVPGITAVLATFHARLHDLQRRFLRIIAAGLGCHERFFDDLLVDGSTLNRAIRYPPMAEAPGVAHVWAAEHGDINLITALPRASGPGLQVKTADGWVDAVAPPDGVVLNTGIMLERLSNGLIPTGAHRVVAAEGGVEARYSVVQFCHPAPWMVLAPVPSCVTEERPLRFGAIEAGALLDRVLWDINLLT